MGELLRYLGLLCGAVGILSFFAMRSDEKKRLKQERKEMKESALLSCCDDEGL